MSYVAGLNVGHDSAVTILDCSQGKVDIINYESERYTKVKQQSFFPLLALKTALSENKNLLSISPEHIASCGHNIGSVEIENNVNNIVNYNEILKLLQAEKFSTIANPKLSTLSHHLCHAYSVLFFSPFDESIIVVADGVGSSGAAYKISQRDSDDPAFLAPQDNHFESISVYLQKNDSLTLVQKIWAPPYQLVGDKVYLSTGLGNIYGAASMYIFGSWQHAGKVMGLAAYGNLKKPPGDFYQYLASRFSRPRDIFKGKTAFDNQPQSNFQQSADIAIMIQNYFEEFFVSFIKDLKQKYPHIKNLSLAGGCALNCLTNTRLVDLKLFDQIFIPPCPNDEGISIGAAYKKALDTKMVVHQTKDINTLSAYLGSKLVEEEMQSEGNIKKHFENFIITKTSNPSQKAAELINSGEVVAWFQGRSECGPRALGNRSLLSLPGIKGRKKYINDHIKHREAFRPYGCSVTLEDAHKYFNCPPNYHMPFMSFAPSIREEKKDILSEVTHPDNSSRIQTVSQGQNERYYKLLKELEKLNGHPVVLNTSLNIMGQPILESLVDAGKFFQTTEINYMFVGDFLISKK